MQYCWCIIDPCPSLAQNRSAALDFLAVRYASTGAQSRHSRQFADLQGRARGFERRRSEQCYDAKRKCCRRVELEVFTAPSGSSDGNQIQSRAGKAVGCKWSEMEKNRLGTKKQTRNNQS